MKPIIIVPPDVLSPDDIKILRDNDLCVITATDPAKVRFLDPLPAAQQRTQMEHAAIVMSRKLLNGMWHNTVLYKKDFADLFVSLLIKGTPLDAQGTTEEQEQQIFDYAKSEEIRRLAHVEAKAERDALKQQKALKTKEK
jgi:hypothetical protein